MNLWPVNITPTFIIEGDTAKAMQACNCQSFHGLNGAIHLYGELFLEDWEAKVTEVRKPEGDWCVAVVASGRGFTHVDANSADEAHAIVEKRVADAVRSAIEFGDIPPGLAIAIC
jgi:hypothetical protein